MVKNVISFIDKCFEYFESLEQISRFHQRICLQFAIREHFVPKIALFTVRGLRDLCTDASIMRHENSCTNDLAIGTPSLTHFLPTTKSYPETSYLLASNCPIASQWTCNFQRSTVRSSSYGSHPAFWPIPDAQHH